MSEPNQPARAPRISGLNFTVLQFVLFAGVGLVGFAALLAGGIALGLALAGAAMLAVVVLAVWIVLSNLLGAGRRRP